MMPELAPGVERILFTGEQIEQRIGEVAEEISGRYRDKNLKLIGVLKGSVFFLAELARRIHDNPELRFEEHRASAWLSEFVAARGHAVEQGVAGMATAFRARAGRGGGPCVAILAEYDALYFSGVTLAVLAPEARQRFRTALAAARSRGRQVAFDTNYRPALWPEPAAARS